MVFELRKVLFEIRPVLLAFRYVGYAAQELRAPECSLHLGYAVTVPAPDEIVPAGHNLLQLCVSELLIVVDGNIDIVATVVRKTSKYPGEFRVVRHGESADAGHQYMSNVGGETTDVAERTDRRAFICCEHRLAGILDDPQTVLPRNLHYLVHGRRLPEKVDYHDSLRASRDLRFYLGRIDVVGSRIDINENRREIVGDDDVARGDKGHCRTQHFVPVFPFVHFFETRERHFKRARSAIHHYGKPHVMGPGECLLKSPQERAVRKPSAFQDLVHVAFLFGGDLKATDADLPWEFLHTRLFEPCPREFGLHHEPDQGIECDLRLPPKLALRFTRVATEVIHLVGAEVIRVDCHHFVAALAVYTDLLESLSLPDELYTDDAERFLGEFTHGVRLSRRNNVITGFFLLQHTPCGFHVLRRVSPIARGIKIAQLDMGSSTRRDLRHTVRYFPRNEIESATRRLVIKEDAVHDEHAVTLAIDTRNLEGVQFCGAVGTSRLKRRHFALGSVLLFPAIQLRSRCLIYLHLRIEESRRLEQGQHAERVGLCSVRRDFERNLHVRLRREIVYFIGFHFAQDGHDGVHVDHVSVVEMFRAFGIGVENMIDILPVEGARATYKPVHVIPLPDKELGEIRPVLTRHSGNKCFFHLKRWQRGTIAGNVSPVHSPVDSC